MRHVRHESYQNRAGRWTVRHVPAVDHVAARLLLDARRAKLDAQLALIATGASISEAIYLTRDMPS